MTHTEDEALKLSLEDYLSREMPAGTVISNPKWWAGKIANAIKQALAEPQYRAIEYTQAFIRGHDAGWESGLAHAAAQPATVQEPVAQWQKRHPERTDGKWENANEHDAKWWRENSPGWEIRALYTSPPAAQPATVQEPVAKYIGECSDGSLVQLYEDVKKGTDFYTTPPAAQPAPVPLTDEQIENLLPDDDTPMSLGEAFVKFARLVEAAHGITKGQP